MRPRSLVRSRPCRPKRARSWPPSRRNDYSASRLRHDEWCPGERAARAASAASPADPDRVLVPAQGVGRTSRRGPRRRSPPAEQLAPLGDRDPGEGELASTRRRGRAGSACGAPRPSRRARRCPARARASGRASRRCRPAPGAKTSKTNRPPGSSSRCTARSAARRSASVSMCSSERNGIDHERERALDRRVAQVAEAQVELDARELGPLARDRRASPADESTPITRIPSAAIGTAIRPVPTPSSTTGPPERRASST